MVLRPICCMHPRAHRPKPLERRQWRSSQKHMTRTWKFMTITFQLISNDIFWLSSIEHPSIFRRHHVVVKLTPLNICLVSCTLNFICFIKISRVFLLRQLFIVNYCVKSSSNILSNENINSVVPEKLYFKDSSFWHFNSCFILKTEETPMFMFWLLRLVDKLLM